MRRSNAGFSVVEGIVGASILVVVLLATTEVFKPIGAAAKKAKILNSMMKVENLIREGVYLQSDYSNDTSFEIQNTNGIVVAKHGVTTFLNDDLSSCDQGAACALAVKAEVVTYGGPSEKGVIYQIASGAGSGAALLPLGVQDWPATSADKQTLVSQNSSFNTSSETVVIPPSLISSTTLKCESGFMRGIGNGNQVMCWEFEGARKCPSWSLPVGYSLDHQTSKIKLLCQKLNRIHCPNMSVNVTSPGGVSTLTPLENFYALNKIVKSDLYPPRANASTGTSECRSIVNFLDPSITNNLGVISAAAVAENKNKCPDVNLYRLVAGTCVPNFNPNIISGTANANIRPNPLNVLAADVLRSVEGQANE